MSAFITSVRLWLAAGAAACGSAVGLGAYGWHALAADEAMRGIFMLGVQYQMWHGLAMLAVAWRCGTGHRPALAAAAGGICFVAGIGLFSGNLYVMGETGEVLFYGGAPAGGFVFMAGWVLLGVSAFIKDSNPHAT